MYSMQVFCKDYLFFHSFCSSLGVVTLSIFIAAEAVDTSFPSSVKTDIVRKSLDSLVNSLVDELLEPEKNGLIARAE